MKTELPYRFPNHADQIYDEAAAFRKLSSSDRFLAIVDMMASAEMMLASSPRRQQMLQQCEAHEQQWQRAQKELFARMDPRESFLAPDLVTGVREIATVFQSRRVAHALIGGMATSYRSRPRSTRDIDFIVQVPQLALPGLLDDLLARGFEFDLATVIRQYVQEHMTVLGFRGVRVDWLKPMLPIYQHVIDRAKPEQWLGTQLQVASSESLIVTKLLAFRDQDQIDITNLLAANRGELDLGYIRQEWAAVGEPDDPRMLRFEEMAEQYYNPPPS